MTTQPTPTYLARTFEDERHAWARTRRVRVRAVLAEAGLLAALVAVTVMAALTSDEWAIPFVAAFVSGTLLFIPLHSLLNLGIRGLFDRATHSLDEHQQRLRDRAHARVGRPVTALTFAAWAGGVALATATENTLAALCLGFLLWFAAGLLPYWHLAWTLADEHGTDDGDDALAGAQAGPSTRS